MSRVNAILHSALESLKAAKDEITKESIQHRDEISKYQTEIVQLHKRLHISEQRINELESDNFRRNQTPTVTVERDHADRTAAEPEESSDERLIDAKLRSLREKYSPERETESYANYSHDQLLAKINRLEASYKDLYTETMSLVRILSSLRTQVKRHKQRATQWQRWSVRQSAIRDTNSHAHPDAAKRQVAAVQGYYQEKPAAAFASPFKSKNTQKGESDVVNSSPIASTASTSSELSAAEAPDTVRIICRQETEMRNNLRSRSPAVRIKDEPISPGSAETSSIVIPAGSQDLDEVGDVVTTPRSRRFTVFEDHASLSQQTTPTIGLNISPRRAFQVKDINTNHVFQFKTPQEPSAKRRKLGDSGECAISTVAEDGEDENYIRKAKKPTKLENDTPSRGVVRNPNAHRRLEDLMEARPRKQKPALDRVSDSALRSVATVADRQEQTGRKEEDAKLAANHGKLIDSTGTSHQNNPSGSASKKEPDWDSIIRNVPLRNLPVDCLNLSHFKPNPTRNQGLDYAFKEVVRGTAQRKCIPGCMRDDCCGEKFRAMVRATGIKYEADQHQAFLEEYLGDRKDLLKTLSHSPEALDGLLIEAKARQLADKFGKHRHSFERARSPPGFWRTDMPTTQEEAEDRLEADRMERAKVQDRIREAMRPNGLWRFADEI